MDGDLKIKILDFDGNQLYQDKKHTLVNYLDSSLEHVIDLETLQIPTNDVVVVSTFRDATSISYLVKPKDLKLKQAPIQRSITKVAEGYKIELLSTTLQKDVFLYCNEKGHFNDNFFDMLPNETKTIIFKTEAKDMEQLNIKTFNNFIR